MVKGFKAFLQAGAEISKVFTKFNVEVHATNQREMSLAKSVNIVKKYFPKAAKQLIERFSRDAITSWRPDNTTAWSGSPMLIVLCVNGEGVAVFIEEPCELRIRKDGQELEILDL